jgi:hypothetical protein
MPALVGAAIYSIALVLFAIIPYALTNAPTLMDSRLKLLGYR